MSLPASVPSEHCGPVQSQHAVPPRQPPVRQPSVGVDLQALNQTQQALKTPHLPGSDKCMDRIKNEHNKVLKE